MGREGGWALDGWVVDGRELDGPELSEPELDGCDVDGCELRCTTGAEASLTPVPPPGRVTPRSLERWTPTGLDAGVATGAGSLSPEASAAPETPEAPELRDVLVLVLVLVELRGAGAGGTAVRTGIRTGGCATIVGSTLRCTALCAGALVSADRAEPDRGRTGAT